VLSAPTPSTTVAVPLHRSARWVENVVANVRALPSPVTEVLISDRTVEDDGAEQLRALLADDPRVQIVSEPRGLGWEEHYQLLLEEAAGELFSWMPHDDRFDPSWVPTLVDALQAHPEAWLAFGTMRCVGADGTTPAGSWPHPEPGPVQGWGALRMVLRNEMGVPFRGVLRRREVLASGLRLEHDPQVPPIDMLWTFALAMRSGLVYDDTTTTWKRFYATSTHARWGTAAPGAIEREVLAVLRQDGPGGATGAAMRAVSRLAWVHGRLRPALAPLRRRARLPPVGP
jgi:hypothetical protein